MTFPAAPSKVELGGLCLRFGVCVLVGPAVFCAGGRGLSGISRSLRKRSLLGEALERRHLLAFDSLLISELMAANSGTLADEDGDYTDWLEIHNSTSSPISLDGWTLSDDNTRLDRWAFPNVTVSAGEYLIVHASGKDRRSPGQPLHTNFRLSSDGESVLLVGPEQSVVDTIEFPKLTDDMSFGRPIVQNAFVTPDSEFRFLAPDATDAPNEQAWADVDFDDTSWQIGVGALGYELRPGFANVGFESAGLSEWESTGEVFVTENEIGIDPSQGDHHVLLTATAGTTSRFAIETFLGLTRSDLNQVDEGIVATRGSAMIRRIQVAADTEIEFDWNFLTNEPTIDGNRDFPFVTLSPGNLVIPLARVTDAVNPSASRFARETGYSRFSLTIPESGDYTLGFGVINEKGQFLDSGLLIDNMTIGGVGAISETFNGFLNTAIDPVNVGSSLWSRYHFEVTNPDDILTLELPIRYDDGYVAYLNGQLVQKQNSPTNLYWDSIAPDERDDDLGFEFEFLSLPVRHLRRGVNVLAINSLATGTDDLNLLQEVQLFGLGDVVEGAVFLSQPTPGRANVSRSYSVTADVQFSQNHGFYDAPFELQMSSETLDATIRYTLDGSVPNETSTLYDGPISIAKTETVRAVAVADGLQSSSIVTQSYLFLDDVITQNGAMAEARGFPAAWQNLRTDYDMDQRIVGQNGADDFNGRYADTIREDLLAIPTLSIVMEMDDLFGTTGIYSNQFGRGVLWERPTSVELIRSDGVEGFQIDAGIRIQGGVSRLISSKMSLRLLFKEQYGASKLQYPLFGSGAADIFDSVSLRASSGEHLIGVHYIRDEFVRRSQLMTANQASRGTYMHVFLNGIYWGMYNPVERIDGQFAANYFGGEKDQYDVYNAGDFRGEEVSPIAGSLDAWNRLVELSEVVAEARTQEEKTAAYLKMQGLNPDGSRNPEWEVYLDAVNFVDYLITQVYAGNIDWPIRNYYMLRQRGSDSTGFKFFVWDAEFTLDQGQRNSPTTITRDGPGVVYQLLDTSEAFRVQFSDRVEHHFSPGGAYYVNRSNPDWDPNQPQDNVPGDLYASLVMEVLAPMTAETARWGDEAARSGRLMDRDGEWMDTVQFNLQSFFPGRSELLLDELRRIGFYRDAPTFGVAEGRVETGTELKLESTPEASVYYTLDGSDPRRPDGSISPDAVRYTAPVVIRDRVNVAARGLANDQWTALGRARYFTGVAPVDVHSLRISELNYNPYDARVEIGELDLDNDAFEFIEIANVSDGPVDLTGVELVREGGEGITFQFGDQTLGFGQHIVIPKNRQAFVSRYGNDIPLAIGKGDDPTAWIYQGQLGNNGEQVLLQTPQADVIQRLSYRDDALWPQRADGQGSSLEVVNVAGEVSEPADFWASVEVGGSPGATGSTGDGDVRINEILANPLDGQSDQIELIKRESPSIDISGWYLSDDPDDLWKYRVPDGTVMVRDNTFVVDSDQLGFGISSVGETILLVSSGDASQRPRFMDVVSIDGSEPGVSLGRWPNRIGSLVPMQRPSLGELNTGPKFADVVISEIHHAPRDPDGTGPLSAATMEFIELTNRSTAEVDLSGWHLQGDVTFTFPQGASLPARSSVVVVSFDPATESTLKVVFDLTFGVDRDVNFLGPWTGKLRDNAGQVQLMKPLAPADQNESVGVLVEQVDYRSTLTWPSDSMTSGKSLQRRSATEFSNFGTNWVASPVTHGIATFDDAVLGDFTQDGVVDMHDIDLLCFEIRQQDFSADLDGNGTVDLDDLDFLLVEVLGTAAGDADLNLRFDSEDLVRVLTAGEYNDGVLGNSTWAEGDWNCDGEFDDHDIVRAFVFGRYQHDQGGASQALMSEASSKDLLAAALRSRSLSHDAEIRLKTSLNRRSRLLPLDQEAKIIALQQPVEWARHVDRAFQTVRPSVAVAFEANAPELLTFEVDLFGESGT